MTTSTDQTPYFKASEIQLVDSPTASRFSTTQSHAEIRDQLNIQAQQVAIMVPHPEPTINSLITNVNGIVSRIDLCDPTTFYSEIMGQNTTSNVNLESANTNAIEQLGKLLKTLDTANSNYPNQVEKLKDLQSVLINPRLSIENPSVYETIMKEGLKVLESLKDDNYVRSINEDR